MERGENGRVEALPGLWDVGPIKGWLSGPRDCPVRVTSIAGGEVGLVPWGTGLKPPAESLEERGREQLRKDILTICNNAFDDLYCLSR